MECGSRSHARKLLLVRTSVDMKTVMDRWSDDIQHVGQVALKHMVSIIWVIETDRDFYDTRNKRKGSQDEYGFDLRKTCLLGKFLQYSETKICSTQSPTYCKQLKLRSATSSEPTLEN